MMTFTCQHSVDQLEEGPLAPGQHLDEEENNEASASSSNEGGDNSSCHSETVSWARYCRLRASVEGKESKDKDEGPKADERNGVANDPGAVDSLDLRSEPSNPWPKHDGTHKGKDTATKMDYARPSKVLELPKDESKTMKRNMTEN